MTPEKKLTVLEVSEQFNQKRECIRGALQKGILKGEKAPDGIWLIDEKEAIRYYTPPNDTNWSDTYVAAGVIEKTPQQIVYMIEEGKLEGKKYKGQWFILNTDLRPYLNGGNDMKEKTAKAKFKVKNSAGIHMRPSIAICKVCQNYTDTTLFLKVKGQTWVHRGYHSVAELLSMCIEQGSTVHLQAYGPHAEVLIDSIIEKADDSFGVPSH